MWTSALISPCTLDIYYGTCPCTARAMHTLWVISHNLSLYTWLYQWSLMTWSKRMCCCLAGCQQWQVIALTVPAGCNLTGVHDAKCNGLSVQTKCVFSTFACMHVCRLCACLTGLSQLIYERTCMTQTGDVRLSATCWPLPISKQCGVSTSYCWL